MRRSLVVTLILAIIAISLTTVSLAAGPANAASSPTFGNVCKTVRAKDHQGVICIGLAAQASKQNRYVWAVVTLRPGAGRLTRASARQLVLDINGHVAQSGVYRVTYHGGSFSLSTHNRNLWDGRPGMPPVRVRAGLFDACMQWRDGTRACTGSHWLYSESEFVLP